MDAINSNPSSNALDVPAHQVRADGTSEEKEPAYYAARSPGALTDELVSMIERVRSARRLSFLSSRLRRNWMMYYGLDDGVARLDDNLYASGSGGEQVRLRTNHYRNIIQHMLVMTTSTRPVLDCKAANSDEKSIRQTEIANAVLEHYFDTTDVYRFIDRSVEQALVLTAGFIHIEWDATAGEPYAVKDTGEQQPTIEDLIFKGDLKFSNITLFDTFFDQSAENFDEVEDIAIRQWVNKYNLIARFPDLEEEIDASDTKKQWNNIHLELPVVFYNPYDTNLVEVFTYYHKKTAAIPDGRMTMFLCDGTVLYDGDLPYARIPVFRVVAAEMLNTPQGYSPATDIAPLQEAVDRLASAIFTNQSAFAVQNIAIPRGANIQIDAIDGGLNAVHYNETGGPNGGLPTPLQLTKSPPEAFKFLEMLVHDLETVSGVNSVARGNPPPGMDAGVALSLVQTEAIQFMNGLQKSYANLLKDIGMFIIETLKTYGQAPRMVAIVGKMKQDSLKEFDGSDLEGITRVNVDLGNPLSRTIAGRMQIAKALVDSGFVLDPQQYLQVLNTGRLEPLTEGVLSQLNCIRGENEILMQGLPTPVLAGDDDVVHIKEHMALLSNPQVRQNAAYVQVVLAHVMEHQQKYLQGDLILGIVSGMIPPGAANGGPPAPPPGGAPPHGQPGHPGGPSQGGPPRPPPRPGPGGPQRRPPPAKQPPGIVPQPNYPTPPPQPRVVQPGV